MTPPEAPVSLKEAKTQLVKMIRDSFASRVFLTSKQNIWKFSVPVDHIDPLAWLAAQSDHIKFFWKSRDDHFTIAGFATAEEIISHKDEPHGNFIARAQKQIADAGNNIRYLGGLSFNPTYAPQGEWQGWGKGHLFIPRIELSQNPTGFTLSCHITRTREMTAQLQEIIPLILNIEEEPASLTADLPGLAAQQNFPDELSWKATVAHVLNNIQAGQYQKLVLARAVKMDFNAKIDPFELMAALRNSAANCFLYLFQKSKNECFLGTSPERLYARAGQNILTEALAGTRPRGLLETEDTAFQDELLSSAKDRSEQNHVTEMIRTNMQSLCTAFRFDDMPSVLRWSGGHHLITRFEGQLKKGINDASSIEKLHPTPAVAGTPARAAVKAIPFIEKFERGWYCGPIGYLGNEKSEFAVAIRSALLKEQSLYLYAGAGIINGSSPASEWDETEQKLANFYKILHAKTQPV